MEEYAASAGRGRPPWLPTLTTILCSQAAAHGLVTRTLTDCFRTRSDHPLSLSCSFLNHALSTAYATCGRMLTSDKEDGPSAHRTVICGASLRALSPCAGWERGLLQQDSLRKGLRKGRHAKTHAHSSCGFVCDDHLIKLRLGACRLLVGWRWWVCGLIVSTHGGGISGSAK